jgi:flagellar M-ring protein FliF
MAAPNMALLYADLQANDKQKIINRLNSLGVEYRFNEENGELLVNSEKVLPLRMQFAGEGLPSVANVTGYEIFDESEPLGTSQFVQNINLIRALEGELSRTINSLDTIESSRVHLVLPKKELFSKTGAEPSASVVLRFKSTNKQINKGEINAISNLIATAVPNLKPANVTIIDTNGKPLKLGAEDEDGVSFITEAARDHQLQLEMRLKKTIEDLLGQSLGPNKVKATVSAEVDFDREVINNESYDPEGQVIRSRKVIEEKEEEKEAVDPLSVATNLPNAQVENGQGGRNKSRTDETTNYEISKTIRNKVIETGKIKKLSIAVLVDYLQNKDEKTGKVDFVPRDTQEIEKITSLVSSAVGFDSERGDVIQVISMPFFTEAAIEIPEESVFDTIKRHLGDLVRSLVLGVVAILVVLLVIRPAVIKSIELKREAMEMAKKLNEKTEKVLPQVIEEEPEPEMAPEERKRAKAIKDVNELVDQNTDEAVNVIRSWLYKDQA